MTRRSTAAGPMAPARRRVRRRYNNDVQPDLRNREKWLFSRDLPGGVRLSPRRTARRLFAAGLVLIAASGPVAAAGAVAPGPEGDAAAPARREPIRVAYQQVDALVQAHRYPEAEALARKLLDETEHAHGPHSLETADAVDALVLALLRNSRWQIEEALILAERAVKIKEDFLGPDDLDVAFSLNALANLHHVRTEYEVARGIAERVAAIREKILGPDDLQVGKALNNLAIEEVRLGDYAAARATFERVTRIFRTAGAREYPEQSTVMNNLSNLLSDMGDYTAALSLLEKVVEIETRALGPDGAEIAG